MNSQSDLVSALQSVVTAERISLRSEDLDTYSRDLWPRFLLAAAGRQPMPSRPQLVVWPKSAAEVQAVLRLCTEHRVPVVPYGAGSGVAGGAVGPSGSVVLDTKQMRKVDIDAARGVVTFEPGIMGWHLEERLNRQGLSLGHFPSSIMCSTAGGWLATRGAGQMSTKYGKIEDMVHSLELCTGAGDRLMLHNGDNGGIDWVQLAVGSEGTLGVITSATCAVRKMPAARKLRGYSFPSIEAACFAIQRLLQRGVRPAVVRLYDEIDTLLSGMGRHGSKKSAPTTLGIDVAGIDFDEVLKMLRTDARKLRGRVERWLVQRLLGETAPITRLLEAMLERFSQGSLMIVGFEGETDIVTAEDAYARDELGRAGGRDLGEAPGEHWLAHRYDVSFKMSRAFRAGAFTDTIEVATTWERLLPLYREVRAAVAPYALSMAHFSHAYLDGCSIYFTLIGRRRATPELSDEENAVAVAEDQKLYDNLWRAAMQATLRQGATISHHHGVGRLKAPYMAAEHGHSLRIFSALRKACDPQHVCNPGNLEPQAELRVAPESSTGNSEAIRVEAQNLLVNVDATVPLYELERTLRKRGLSLGGLPPRAFMRTVGEALQRPHASEASLGTYRLRDRRAALRMVCDDGEELVVPPRVVPRRATGPDLGHALMGHDEKLPTLGTLRAATLRVVPLPHDSQWTGFLFADAEAAAQALFIARALHGAVGFFEVLLVDHALLLRVLGEAASAEMGYASYALLVLPSGPELLGRAACKELAAQLGDSFSGRLSAPLCRDFWHNAALHGESATEKSIAEFAAKTPKHETALSLADSSPERVAALLTQAGDGRLLCGVYLHGLTLCTDAHLSTAEAPSKRSSKTKRKAASAQTPVPQADAGTDAQAVLWPRLIAALGGD